MSFFSERMVKTKMVTVKIFNVTTFKEPLSITLFSNLVLNKKILGY